MQERVKFHGSGNRQVCALCCKGKKGLFSIAAWFYCRFAVNVTCPACVRLWGLDICVTYTHICVTYTHICVRVVTVLQYELQKYA